jgi:Lon protease-like protein
MICEVSVRFDRPLPLFPLPEAVLLPHAAMPLHIFEPRYRRMVGDVIDSHGLIAMALFQGPVSEAEYLRGKPALRPYVGLGYTEHYQNTDDGRFIIVLRGLLRCRLTEEVDHQPYRKAMLQPIDPAPTDDRALAHQRRRIMSLLNDPLLAALEPIKRQLAIIDEQTPTDAVIDVLIDQLCEDAELRYTMLTQPSPQRRAQWLLEQLQMLRQQQLAQGSTEDQ